VDSASPSAAAPGTGARAPALRLERARVPELVLGVLRALHAAGKQAFLAGGAVRDLARLALGQTEVPSSERWPADFDVATDALPEEVLALFPRAIPTGIQHGTVTVLARGGEGADREEHKVEVTTFRGEGPYLDGRRPSSVTFLGDIEGDLARRDFTVNAMAWDPLAPDENGLRDPFGGLDDLRRRRLRAVGDARARFTEDGLRPLRAVRFAATLRLALERQTEKAIGETLPTFAQVAQERVRDELEKLLVRGQPASRGARVLLRTGLLAAISPALAEEITRAPGAWRRALRALDLCRARGPEPLAGAAEAWGANHWDPTQLLLVARFALLFSPLGPARAAQLCEHLRFPLRQRDRVQRLLAEAAQEFPAAVSDGDCRRAMARIGPGELAPLFAMRCALAAADGAADRDGALVARWAALLAERPPLTLQALAVDGRELMRELHLAPGPLVGQLLRALLERLFDDPSLNSRAALLRLASELAGGQFTGNSQA